MKLVINKCFGGFGLSLVGLKRYVELGGQAAYFVTLVGKLDEQPVYMAPPQKWIDENNIYKVEVSTVPPEQTTDETIVWQHKLDRTDQALVQAVEELGEKANGAHAKLKVVEIPDGIKYYIDEYDGNESVHEAHESWG